MPSSTARDECQYTYAVEIATGEIPGPVTYGCEAGPLEAVTIPPAPANVSVQGGNIERTPVVVTVCSTHARMLRAQGHVVRK
jgi:hypothetical protein